MMIEEFAERTGFRPSYDYYATVIEPEYMNGEDDKGTFCRKWKDQGGIQMAYNALRTEVADKDEALRNELRNKAAAQWMADHYREERDALKAELEALKAALKTITKIMAA